MLLVKTMLSSYQARKTAQTALENPFTYTDANIKDIAFLSRRFHMLTDERQINHLSFRNSKQVYLATEAGC